MGKIKTMIVLTIKTDNPKAELGLYEDLKNIGQINWQAHRQLSKTIHKKIDELLHGANKELKDLDGVVSFKGPGSFTGLRIGLSVANALAYSLKIPIVSAKGDKWAQNGINDLLLGKNETVTLPEYNRPAITTKPSK